LKLEKKERQQALLKDAPALCADPICFDHHFTSLVRLLGICVSSYLRYANHLIQTSLTRILTSEEMLSRH
jgi:hypothetical protein